MTYVSDERISDLVMTGDRPKLELMEQCVYVAWSTEQGFVAFAGNIIMEKETWSTVLITNRTVRMYGAGACVL